MVGLTYVQYVCKLLCTIFFTYTKSLVSIFLCIYLYIYIFIYIEIFHILPTSICTTIMKKRKTFTDMSIHFSPLFYITNVFP